MLAHPTNPGLINIELIDTCGYGYRTKMSPQNHRVSIVESQHCVINAANPGGALDDGVEDWLHVSGRTADNAEHFGRCRLMLQRFAQFCIALLQFLEQPHVLDGDHGLVCEGFKKCNLLFREWPDLVAANQD